MQGSNPRTLQNLELIWESYRDYEEIASVGGRKPKETVFWKANEESVQRRRVVYCMLALDQIR